MPRRRKGPEGARLPGLVAPSDEDPRLMLPVRRPTPYQQARFCHEVGSWGSVPNEPAFLAQGYTLRPFHPTLSDLRIAMYVPDYFPATRSVGRTFQWGRMPREVGLGFVVQGTDGRVLETLKADWDVFCKRVGGQGPLEVAQRASSLVLQRLDDLIDDFPALGKKRIAVHLTGHSLGGLVAASVAVMLQPWADWRGAEIRTTTFESPGLVPHYWDVAREQGAEMGVWRRRIVNYLAYPNPINMMHRHLGRIVFLDVLRGAPTTLRWAANCLSSSALRAYPWAAATAKVAIAAGLGSAVGAPAEGGYMTQMATALAVRLGNVGPIDVLLSIAAYLGLEIDQIIEQHAMTSVLRCFNSDESGEPWGELATEMDSWPCYESLGKMSRVHFWGLVEFFVPFMPGNAGVHNLANRQRFLMSRLQRLEGFVPARTAQGQAVLDTWHHDTDAQIITTELDVGFLGTVTAFLERGWGSHAGAIGGTS